MMKLKKENKIIMNIIHLKKDDYNNIYNKIILIITMKPFEEYYCIYIPRVYNTLSIYI